jgi:hypothetical protein
VQDGFPGLFRLAKKTCSPKQARKPILGARLSAFAAEPAKSHGASSLPGTSDPRDRSRAKMHTDVGFIAA